MLDAQSRTPVVSGVGGVLLVLAKHVQPSKAVAKLADLQAS